jgi:hypothetical protein
MLQICTLHEFHFSKYLFKDFGTSFSRCANIGCPNLPRVTWFCVQVLDYYLLLKMNDSSAAMMALYRLFLAGTMLRNVKVRGTRKAHDYPKMQLTNILILEYWRSIDHVAWKIIIRNMSMVNEELGEMTFSVLSRCVLGDTLKSQFEHLSKMYTLLPVYREVKNDIRDDNGVASTISWRYNVNPDGEEVNAVTFFFNQLIRRLTTTVSIQTYDGTSNCFKNSMSAAANMSHDVTEQVYDQNVLEHLPTMFQTINHDLHTSTFLEPFPHIWPLEENPGEQNQQLNMSMESLHFSGNESEGEEVIDYVNSWERCIIGHYAVTRAEWPSENGVAKYGICVYKIKSIDEEVVHDGDDIYHSFQGYELSCNKPKYSRSSADSGRWYAVRSDGVYNTTAVMSWAVIVFFTKLNNAGTLPRSVIRELNIADKEHVMFTE